MSDEKDSTAGVITTLPSSVRRARVFSPGIFQNAGGNGKNLIMENKPAPAMPSLASMSAKERAAITKDQAKLILACRALIRLSTDEDPWTLKMLFGPEDDTESDIRAMIDAGRTKAWQQALVERLINLGLVKRVMPDGRTNSYEATDLDTLLNLASQAPHVKWLLYPGNYEVPECVQAKMFQSPTSSPHESAPPPKNEAEADETISKIAEDPIRAMAVLLSVTAENASRLTEIRQAQQSLESKLISIENMAIFNHKATSDKIDVLDAKAIDNIKQRDLMASLASDVKRAADDLINRAEKIQNANQWLVRELASRFDAFLVVVRKEIRGISTIVSLAEKISSIRAQFAGISGMTKILSENSSQFESGVKDALAMSDMVLDVASQLEKELESKHEQE